MKVAVLGAKGRMGTEAVAAINSAPDLTLSAALDIGDSLEKLTQSGTEIVVDFTTPDSVMKNLEFAINNGIHVVVGTTGFDDTKLDSLKNLLSKHPKVGALIAPNFGLGAVLMMQFSQTAAKYFESAEIIEMHHANKIDAPSGTAMRTAEMITDSRKASSKSNMPDATKTSLPGARGAKVGDVPVHSIRGHGYVAHQEVVFSDAGETLTIRHDSINRSGFMPGVLIGIRNVAKHPGLTVGLENYMGGIK
jgi:4-hydroxy-tetrahydrodipicolinate reductase